MNNPILLGIKQYPFYLLLIIFGFITFLFFPEGLLFIAGSIAFITWLKEFFENRKINNFRITSFDKPKIDQYRSHEEKQQYLSTTRWKKKKMQVHLRDLVCQSCGSSFKLVVHHLRYDNLGDEPLEDLILLCSSCHEKLHQKLGYNRQQNYPINKICH